MSEKLHAQIKKLAESTAKFQAKIAANGERTKALVGKLAGVKPGDVVTWKGERYSVTNIFSDGVPEKGLPVLLGAKILKNGKTVKSETTIKGAWKPEANAAKVPAKVVTKVTGRRGRPPRVPAAAPGRVSRRAALAAIAPEGTA
jgi:hypothetical protein